METKVWWELDVLPCFALHQIANCSGTNTVLFGDGSLAFTRTNSRKDFPGLIVSQFGAGALLAFWGIVSALCEHVKCVFARSSRKEVRWINASLDIATMAYKESGRYGAIAKFITDAMSKGASVVFADLPVAIGLYRAYPQPTFIGRALINACPKTFFERQLVTRLVSGYKANGLTLNFMMSLAGFVCNVCFLAATAQAQPTWVRLLMGSLLAVSQNIADCLAFDVSECAVRHFRNWCGLTTSTFAKFHKNASCQHGVSAFV